jgi:hypothetical protein
LKRTFTTSPFAGAERFEGPHHRVPFIDHRNGIVSPRQADRALGSQCRAALLVAGMGGGLSAPSAQIGALSGVTHSMTGLASGLVETLREIGGAVSVAAVSTILVSRTGEIAGEADPVAREAAAVNAFHAAFWVMFVAATLGALTAAIAFPRRTTQVIELEPAPSELSVARTGETIVMKRIRIERPKQRRDRWWPEVLPIDPCDSDVVRIKSRAYGLETHPRATAVQPSVAARGD